VTWACVSDLERRAFFGLVYLYDEAAWSGIDHHGDEVAAGAAERRAEHLG
jgi:hypothetical protein